MTLVDPKDDLSIFKHAQHKNRAAGRQSNQSNDNVDDDQLKKKVKRSNEISISLSGGSASVINNGFSSADHDDDSERDISKRIFQCLSINVSHIIFFSSFFKLIQSNEMFATHGERNQRMLRLSIVQRTA